MKIKKKRLDCFRQSLIRQNSTWSKKFENHLYICSITRFSGNDWRMTGSLICFQSEASVADTLKLNGYWIIRQDFFKNKFMFVSFVFLLSGETLSFSVDVKNWRCFSIQTKSGILNHWFFFSAVIEFKNRTTEKSKDFLWVLQTKPFSLRFCSV